VKKLLKDERIWILGKWTNKLLKSNRAELQEIIVDSEFENQSDVQLRAVLITGEAYVPLTTSCISLSSEPSIQKLHRSKHRNASQTKTSRAARNIVMVLMPHFMLTSDLWHARLGVHGEQRHNLLGLSYTLPTYGLQRRCGFGQSTIQSRYRNFNSRFGNVAVAPQRSILIGLLPLIHKPILHFFRLQSGVISNQYDFSRCRVRILFPQLLELL